MGAGACLLRTERLNVSHLPPSERPRGGTGPILVQGLRKMQHETKCLGKEPRLVFRLSELRERMDAQILCY